MKVLGIRTNHTPVMKNQMEKEMENEMETVQLQLSCKYPKP